MSLKNQFVGYDPPASDVLTLVRQTQTLPQTATESIFSIEGDGLVLLGIVGEVTVAIELQANDTRLLFNTDGTGSDVNLCANLDITNDAVGTMYSTVGVLLTAMKSTSQGVVIPVDNIPAPGVVLNAGDIQLVCAASNDGSVKWSIVYMLIGQSSVVVA